jgi:hypothetical protein
MKIGRLKRRALTSYFLPSGQRRGLVVLMRNKQKSNRNSLPFFRSSAGFWWLREIAASNDVSRHPPSFDVVAEGPIKIFTMKNSRYFSYV